MKLVSSIFAFYLLLLSAVPCCSFDDCPGDKTEQTACHEKGDEPACPADRDCGNCSPFFNCEGCATATIANYPCQFEIMALQNSPIYTSYIPGSLPRVDYDFWQPPQLG